MAYGPRGDHAADKGFGAGGDGGDGFVRARGRRESSFFLQVTSHFISKSLFKEDMKTVKFHQQQLPVHH